MTIAWGRMLPVLVSIAVIIAVAILREYSRNFAAIAAVMPLNIPLGMWIVYSSAEDQQQAITDFSSALLLNIIPTLIFMLIAWQTSKAGWGLLSIVVAGYSGWAVMLGLVFGLRALV